MPISSKIKEFGQRLVKRFRDFLDRRPHRSFRRTRRRDYIRPLELPGNIAFTIEVNKTLWKYKRIFALLAVVYVLFYGVLVGIQSQEAYGAMGELLKETGGDIFSGNWGSIGQAGILLAGIASGSVNTGVTEVQQFFGTIIFLFMWLTTVWLLRNLLAGHKVRLRDGIYNSGAPVISTALIAVLIVIQLLPVAIAAIGYGAAAATGLLSGGAATMLFWLAAACLTTLSLYWITSSLFAMIVVTLPGTYPYQAIKAAGDIVLGRRTKILLRWLWMLLMIALASLLVLIPIILIDMGLKNMWPSIDWLPIVPFSFLIFASIAAMWMASYVYLLYRKIVDYEPTK